MMIDLSVLFMQAKKYSGPVLVQISAHLPVKYATAYGPFHQLWTEGPNGSTFVCNARTDDVIMKHMMMIDD